MKAALLFTDIEGSTRLLERSPEGYAQALRQHHEILRAVAAKHGGREFQDAGDGLLLAFGEPRAAAQAAREMQRALAAAEWPEETGTPQVRMALHWAESEFREGQYRGPAVHFAARLLAAGHGGQVLCSSTVAGELDGEAHRLGTYRLRGFEKAEAIFQLGDEKTFPPLRTGQARRHNLPATHDAFVGRAEELAALRNLLEPGRLVTLSGAGGIGKTRLALAAARELLERYDHGVLFVALAQATSARDAPGTILAALGAKTEGDPLEQITELLAGTPSLLVLDNFEQLAAEGAPVVNVLRARLPQACFLITSRARLGVAGESEFPLRPFPVPPEGKTGALENYDCVRLFAERAGRKFAKLEQAFDFLPDGEDKAEAAAPLGDLETVAAICRLLDGVPLAIELAAARLPVMTAQELLEALRKDFSALEGQRGLEAVFDWSCRLLPPEIARFLGALSVFRGGWTAASAAEVGNLADTSLALAYLHYLLTCSLVHAAEDAGGMRFAMLEPIRQIAMSRLEGEEKVAVRRHGEYFRRLVARVRTDSHTGGEEVVARDLEPEIANVLAALEREPSNQERLFSAVDFHSFALYRSCNRRVRMLLAEMRPEGGEVSLRTQARAWNAAGALDLIVKDLEAAEAAFRTAADLFERNGEEEGAASAQFNLALIVGERGRHLEAYEALGGTLDFFRARDSSAYATVLLDLGSLAGRAGRLEEACSHLQECLAACRQNGQMSTLANALKNLADVQLEAGNWPGACANLEECLDVWLRLGQRLYFGEILRPLGMAALAATDFPAAAFFHGAMQSCDRKENRPHNAMASAAANKMEQACRAELGDDLFQQEAACGATSSIPDWKRAARQIGEKNRFFRKDS